MKMKNNKYKHLRIYSILLVAIVLMASCNDAIDVEPQDEVLESNAITSVDDVETARFAVYGTIGNNGSIFWNALFTDELRLPTSNNGQGVQVHTWSIDAGEDDVEPLYDNYYVAINRANRLLSVIPSIPVANEDDQARMDQYEGELLAIRAWAHFKLLTLFSTSYTDDSVLAVPYIDFVVVLETPSRNTVGEVYERIDTDLANALSKIPEDFNDNTLFTRNAIIALQARMALYREDYQMAIDKSTQLIDDSQYELATIGIYPLLWLDANESENIFKLARVVGDGQVGQLFTSSPGVFDWLASDKITQAYDLNDVRLNTFIASGSNQAILKYPGVPGNIGLNDIKLFRISEQYLIRAEAYARTSQLSLAADDVNALRSNRINGVTPLSFASPNQAVEAVMEERYREFAFEGHRFFDLKRNGMDVERQLSDCEILNANACQLPNTDFKFTLPIPQSEIFANGNMVQNPGY